MLKSLAGTNKKDYKPLQIRITEVGRLNIQGRGISVNRDYGVAEKVPVEEHETLTMYLLKRHALVPSLAGTDAVYVPMQAAIREDRVHLQFEGKAANREYGAAFDIPTEELPSITAFLGGEVIEAAEPDEEDEEPEVASSGGCF